MPDALNAALLVVRIALGVIFLAHGVKHFINRDKTIRWTASIGYRQPTVQWAFMTFGEIAIGLFLALGLLTGFAAAGTVAMMFVAFWTVHRAAGFWITARPDEGYEYAFLIGATAVVLALAGPGEWSLDEAMEIAVNFDEGVGAVLVAGGVVAGVVQLLLFYRPSATRNAPSA